MTAASHAPSYYAASVGELPSWPRLEGDTRADVCVVGGGYTGLHTALNLAERGYDVVLLEANRIGWGASGRNGGQVCSGFSPGADKMEAWVGKDDAKKLFAFAEEAKAIVRERVARHRIDCELKQGYFNAAVKPRQLRYMIETKEVWERDYDYPHLELAETPEAARRYVHSPYYVGGMADHGAGHLHPLKYCLGLARAAQEAGVRLHEDSAVTTVEQSPRAAASTAHGRVEAKFLVLAGNAYLGHLVPEIAGKIMPLGNYMVATEPLGDNRARAMIPSDFAVSDWNFILNYYRLSADRRLLFGGLASYSTMTPPNLRGTLKRTMLKTFPSLNDVEMDYAWGGYVGITMERTPHVGRLGDTVYFAHGFSGNGVALTGMAGKVIAEAVAGQAERFDLFARLPHTTFPGGRLMRMPTLVLAMAWFRMRDWLP